MNYYRMEKYNRYLLRGMLIILFVYFLPLNEVVGQTPSGQSAKIKERKEGKQVYLLRFYEKGEAFSIHHPEAFLSARAIDRRKKWNIPITEEDLPVNPAHLQKLRQVEGLQVIHVSKWFNMAAVDVDDRKVNIEDIMLLPFVKEVKYIGFTPHRPAAMPVKQTSDTVGFQQARSMLSSHYIKKDKAGEELETVDATYGGAWAQMEMLAGHKLHKWGYTGKGIHIAVFDAGFKNADKMDVFEHLFSSNRILGWRDLVDFDGDVFDDDSHGTHALSCMAAHKPGKMIGTAPDASYLLVRTENEHSETRLEEMSWIAGAEFADSMGVDIISSSLGYTTFDEKEFHFTQQMLDGKTTYITRAADMAVSKGIFVFNSAGNSGNSSWKTIGAPADGMNVISVGGVDYQMMPSTFSSRGPTADGRVKPELSAIASQTVVANPNGSIGNANGTSFSNPVVAGMFGSFLQVCPTCPMETMKRAMILSASHASNGNMVYGWGVPDFEYALAILGKHPQGPFTSSFLWESDYKHGLAGSVIRYYAHQRHKVTFRFLGVDEQGKRVELSKASFKTDKRQFLTSPWLLNLIVQNHQNLPSADFVFEVKRRWRKPIRVSFYYNREAAPFQ
jgi:serine protease AprX